MSKIGKINIAIPDKVKVALNGNLLNIEGPLGKKSLNIDTKMFELVIDDGKTVSIKPKETLSAQISDLHSLPAGDGAEGT